MPQTLAAAAAGDQLLVAGHVHGALLQIQSRRALRRAANDVQAAGGVIGDGVDKAD